MSFLVLLVLTIPITGCEGCRQKVARPHPLQFVSTDAGLLLEIPAVGFMALRRDDLRGALAPLLNEQQWKNLVEEARGVLGFDPTTPEGWRESGLSATDPGVAAWSQEGDGILFVLPVDDKKRVELLLERLFQNIAPNADFNTSTKDLNLTVVVGATHASLEGSILGAWVFEQGHVIVGVGEGPEAIVLAARSRRPEQSVLSNAEFSNLSKSLSEPHDLRLIAPNAKTTAQRRFPGAGLESAPGKRLDPTSAGLGVRLAKASIRSTFRLRVSEGDVAAVQRAFAKDVRETVTLGVLEAPEAFVRLEWSLLPEGILSMLGGETKAREIFQRLVAEADLPVALERVDFEPLRRLSGGGTAAVGLRDLGNVDWNDPRVAPIWLLLAVDAKSPGDASALADLIRSNSSSNSSSNSNSNSNSSGFALSSQTSKRTVFLASDPVLLSQKLLEGQMTGTREAARTEGGPGLLGGKSGFAAELRFDVLAARVRSLKLGSIPLLFRAMVSKALEILDGLETLTVFVRPERDGVSGDATLRLRAAVSKRA